MAKNGNIHPTRIFKTPDDLKKAFEEYKENLKEQANEWLKIQYVGREGERMADAQKVPMTLEGLKRFCRENYGEIEQYFVNQDNYYEDFISICRAIKEEIRENQIVGGLLGMYNPSITQRLNNLTERTQTEITGGLNIPNLPDIGKR